MFAAFPKNAWIAVLGAAVLLVWWFVRRLTLGSDPQPTKDEEMRRHVNRNYE